jgi:deoxyadenosine/deoxycytidine kinase
VLYLAKVGVKIARSVEGAFVALYITLCGNIGIGKTTLAGLMAERWRWQLFAESVEDHPYLADYYADRTRWALASQLVFLERTFQQQITITQGEVNAVQERSAENFMFMSLPVRSTSKKFCPPANTAPYATSI